MSGGALLTALLACSPQAPEPAPAPPEPVRPDVLLVVLDTVRADALDAYGYDRVTAPVLDRLAERGVLFEDVTTSGTWSWPSHASLFTGEPPWVHGAHFAGSSPDGYVSPAGEYRITALRSDLPTLAQRFADAGYRTVSATSNRWLDRGVGLDRGFQEVHFAQGERVIERVRDAVRDRDERPLFLFVNLFDVHAPYQVRDVPWLRDRSELDPETAPSWLAPYLLSDGTEINLFRGSEEVPNGVFAYAKGELEIPPEGLALLRDVYDGEVHNIDRELGRVLKLWRSRGGERVVAVTSDHGEFLGERGRLDHGRSVYPELSAVPLLLAGLGRLPAGRRISTPVQLESVYDTLLDLADIEHGERSLLPVIEGGPGPEILWAMAWADDLWPKFVGPSHNLGERLYRVGDEALVIRGNDVRYFQLDSDPGMVRDLAGAWPARTAALAAAAVTIFPENITTDLIALEPDVAQPLRAMGYLE